MTPVEQHGVAAQRRQQHRRGGDRDPNHASCRYSGRSWRNHRHTRKTATGMATAAPAARPDLRVMGRLVDGDRQPGADRRRSGEHEIVAVAPDDRLAQAGEQIVHRPIEVHPPHRVHDQQPADDQRHQRRQRFAGRQRRLDGDGRREDRLAEHDQREQAVPFGDVMRVPRGRRGALGPYRHRQFERRQRDEARAPKVRDPEQLRDPRELQDRDAERRSDGPSSGAPDRTLPPAATARPSPVASRRSRRWSARLGTCVSNIAGTPAGQDQRAGDLHEHREPVRHVVAVVGRGEPGEVHPRPPDGEEHHQVADEPLQPRGLRRSRDAGRSPPGRWRRRRRGRTAARAAWRRGACSCGERAVIRAIMAARRLGDGRRLRHRLCARFYPLSFTLFLRRCSLSLRARRRKRPPLCGVIE